MASREELAAHVDDCAGWRKQVQGQLSATQGQLTTGFAGIDSRLDTQDELLEFVKESQSLYNGAKRVAGLTSSLLGFLVIVIEAMRGLGVLN